MLTEAIRPSTLDGIKRLAKTIGSERGIKHTKALDVAAKAAGYQNYRHAQNRLAAGAPAAIGHPQHQIYLTAYWRDETGASGRETLTLHLDAPWNVLLTPSQIAIERSLREFRPVAPDHLEGKTLDRSQDAARHAVCMAARALQFINATKLRPSNASSTRALGIDPTERLPGSDHKSLWYEPATKRYLLADEPYQAAVEQRTNERNQWAATHGYLLVKSPWRGMYAPDQKSQLYLISNAAKGVALPPIEAALTRLPAPIMEEPWTGISAPTLPLFQSPGAVALGTKIKKPAALRSNPLRHQKNTINYGRTSGGHTRRRPDRRMPIQIHEELGCLLKSVLTAVSRKAVSRPIDHTRCELDDWIQREYNDAELPMERFVDVYYRDSGVPTGRKTAPEEREGHIVSLQRSKALLTHHYPDCAPLRGILKRLDKAISALSEWA